jgi:predicted DNA-binding protein (MmcQ/YjbR family)
MAKADPVLAKVRAIYLSFPDTKETLTWGTPHFRVGDKIFGGYGAEDGRASIGFKLEMDHARAILRDKRFTPAPYVGHKGWVSMALSGKTDWDQVRDLVEESYELIAPKKSLAKLSPGGTALLEPKTTKKKAKKPATKGRTRGAK